MKGRWHPTRSSVGLKFVLLYLRVSLLHCTIPGTLEQTFKTVPPPRWRWENRFLKNRGIFRVEKMSIPSSVIQSRGSVGIYLTHWTQWKCSPIVCTRTGTSILLLVVVTGLGSWGFVREKGTGVKCRLDGCRDRGKGFLSSRCSPRVLFCSALRIFGERFGRTPSTELPKSRVNLSSKAPQDDGCGLLSRHKIRYGASASERVDHWEKTTSRSRSCSVKPV